MPTNREFLNALAKDDPSKLTEWMDAEHVDGLATHESRESYEERMYEVPVSDCPYCGCDRVVIHEYSDMYERPHSYRVEHMNEREAFNAGCFESYFAFDSVEEAVRHADMRAGEAQADEQFSVSLADENAELRAQLDEARDEAIMYRVKFGAACDLADEIRRMM